MRVPKLTGWCSRPCRISKTGRLSLRQIRIRQEKRFFCVLVCSTCSTMYVFSRVALEEILKIGLELKVVRSEVHFVRPKEESFYWGKPERALH